MIGRIVRAADVRRRVLVVATAVFAPLAVLGSASPALATEHHPTGEFAPFKDCPLSNSETNDCVYAETIGGKFTIGKRTVPITQPVILQGGFHVNEAKEGLLEFIGAENGETLSKTPQPVPGGQTKTVTLRLTATGKKLLARGHTLSARATIAAHDPAGATHTGQAVVTLRAQKPKHK